MNVQNTGLIVVSMVVFCFFYTLLIRVYEGFRLNVASFWEIVLSQFLSCLIIDVSSFLVACVALKQLYSMAMLLALLVVQVLISCLWTKFAIVIYIKHVPMIHAVVVYCEKLKLGSCENLQNRTKKIKVESSLQITTLTEETLTSLESYDMVIINDLEPNQRNEIVSYCALHNIEVVFYPQVSDVLIGGADNITLLHKSARYCHSFNLPFEYILVKRFFDILLSAIALVVLSPLMLITAVAVSGRDIPYEFGQRRKGDLAISYADVQKAAHQLHFKAAYTLSDMCRNSWNWYKNNR